LHDAQRVLHAEERPQHVGIEHRSVALGREFRQRTDFALGAGAVDCYVETAKAGDGAVDQIADIVLEADISADELRLGAGGKKLGGQCLAFRLAAAGDDDLGAILGEGQGGGAADTCQAAGDQNDWVAHWTSSSKIGVGAGE
jgi:hypothetical protein